MKSISGIFLRGTRRRTAFTLAEMMIVLLIMSIILAAFAPIMTRRAKSARSGESLWSELITNGPGIYYGTHNAESVIIGANSKNPADSARLILKKGTSAQNYMLFKDESGTANAGLYIDSSNMHFGSVPAGTHTTRTNNTSFGIGALANTQEGWSNVAVGTNSGNANVSGNGNIFIGFNAGKAGTSESQNTIIGFGAGQNNTTGSNSVYLGSRAGQSNTTGDGNTFLGFNAGDLNKTGSNNVFSGLQSGFYNNSADNNSYYGYRAGIYATGSNNSFFGYMAGSGTYNTITGSNNTALGYNACSSLTSGSYKTCIGSNSQPYTKTGTNHEITLGDDSTDVRVPGALYVKTVQVTSDKRLKNIQGENNEGLDKIKQLKVFNFTLKSDEKKTPRMGIIAQDLKKILPQSVHKDEKGYLSIQTEYILYSLVNAVKELDKKIHTLAERIANQYKKIQALEEENAELKVRLSRLEAKIK
ncbi:MAG: tail fiber domain-containing protein [Heliobacteriaceae bacterium]|jgi:prepilin-type N-terminal cleavage/methylation domain-containing protein|nr:tail fiber domain-containing protein [Heliobacteriaceae bacterium]